MPRLRTATENHAAQLAAGLRADVDRIQHDYAALEALLAEAASTVSALCERLNGPHDGHPYDDEASSAPA